ncbi:stress response protein NST1 [Chloropicon primus]|uniref:Stress response protein NST1 n=1 Tax=Chloropicon primus TaxID=1764295 RepID=A0A5B8MS43_9CHLO|nr:stress response protein NST1 [Chloropicon primus]|eukprot:QDZ23273.1 stress response protein NST1 [Chloropicon primus]
MEHDERALEAARSSASEAALLKALRGRKGRWALNELLSPESMNPSSSSSSTAMATTTTTTTTTRRRSSGQCPITMNKEEDKVDEYAGLNAGSLEDILSNLPPPPEGANDKDYAAYAAAAAQYTQQAASALKIDVESIQGLNPNLNGVYHREGDRGMGHSVGSTAASLGMGLPLLPGMEEAAALLRASGAHVGVGTSSSGSALDTHSLQDSLLEDTLGKSGGGVLPGYGGCPLPGGPGSGERGVYGGGKHAKGKGFAGNNGAGSGGSNGNSIVSFWDMDADKTEQEKLRAFWLGLSEAERRDLVKIEKQAILKEMKGQQKYICSCSVCGRRREVLEEELEMLYDAYYAELALDKKTKELEGRKELEADGKEASNALEPGARSRITAGGRQSSGSQGGAKKSRLNPTYDSGGEDSSEDMTLSNSLTVRGDMLTVCDDLLEDDGQRFFDLLLKIAESRYHYRDELSGLDAAEFDDDDFDDLTDDEDDLTDEDDEDTDNEDSDYLEEQRMEEGRRMFQMFAARMIEQRLLVAYREKCSLEAQEQLIREEEEAEREKEERQRLKKEKEKERKKKRKEQKKAQKAAGEAEKLRKQKLEEEAKLEAKRKKEVLEKKRKEEREQQRIKEERDRNIELARRREELQRMKEKEDQERRRVAEMVAERQQQQRAKQNQQPKPQVVKVAQPPAMQPPAQYQPQPQPQLQPQFVEPQFVEPQPQVQFHQHRPPMVQPHMAHPHHQLHNPGPLVHQQPQQPMVAVQPHMAHQLQPPPPHIHNPGPLVHQQPPPPQPQPPQPQQPQQQQQQQGERSEILSLLPTDLLDSLEL